MFAAGTAGVLPKYYRRNVSYPSESQRKMLDQPRLIELALTII
jgi:hypothetical protein